MAGDAENQTRKTDYSRLTVKWRKEKGASSRAEESEKDCFVVLKS